MAKECQERKDKTMSGLDPRIDEILNRLARIEALLNGSKTTKEVASDDDLDSAYGDPQVKFLPQRMQDTWSHLEGKHFSECPADFLEDLAGFLEWKAGKQEKGGEVTTKGQPKAKYTKRDAAMARGWALRIKEQEGRGL